MSRMSIEARDRMVKVTLGCRSAKAVASFEAQVSAARAEDEDVRAILAADGSVRHAKVVQIIDLLRRLEVTKFAINVRQTDLEGGSE